MLPNQCKPRSSLRQVTKEEGVDGEDTTVTNRNLIKRRISFGAKKHVRVFNDTEHPVVYDKSFEVSEHTNDEDSGTAAGASSLTATLGKGNAPQSSFQVDSTFNLHASIDVTLLPNELMRKAGNGHGNSVAIPRPTESSKLHLTSSFYLSPEIRDQFRDNCFKHHPILDKTTDLLPDCVKPSQNQRDQSLALFKPVSKNTPEDASPLGTSNQEDTSPISSHSSRLTPRKSNTFDSFDAPVVNNSSLLAMDVLSVERKRVPMTLRKLNDELETGNISVCLDGPKTPSTDKQFRYQRYREHNAFENPYGNIKPREALNFSECIVPLTAAPVVVPPSVPKHKMKYRYSQADEMLLDNTNFLAHAKLGDETESRNSSSHAEITDINYSNYNSRLELEPSGQKAYSYGKDINIQEPRMDEERIPKTKRRETLLNEESMEQDDLMSSLREMQLDVNIPKYGNENKHQQQGQSLTFSEIQKKYKFIMYPDKPIEDDIEHYNNLMATPGGALQPGLVTKQQRSKARSTLLMSEPIEEDTVTSHKDGPSLVPTGNVKSKTRNTILLTEPIEEDFNALRQDDSKVPYYKPHKTKARSTLLVSEDIEEDKVVGQGQTGNLKSKTRNTLLMSEPIEEDTVASQKDLPPIVSTGNAKSLARITILLTEPIEEDFNALTQDDSEFPFPKPNKTKSRSTLLVSEDIEEDTVASTKDLPPLVPIANPRTEVKNTLPATEPIEEEKLMSLGRHIPEIAFTKYEKHKTRSTLLMSEAIEEDTVASNKDWSSLDPTGNVKSKARNTILLTEPMEEDFNALRQDDSKVPYHKPHKTKARSTLLVSEDIEEDKIGTRKDWAPLAHTGNLKSKTRNTLLMSEPIEEDTVDSQKDLPSIVPTGNVKSKARNTILLIEPIEEDFNALRQDDSKFPFPEPHKTKSRSTWFVSEDIKEDTAASLKDFASFVPNASPKAEATNTSPTTEPMKEEKIMTLSQDVPEVPFTKHEKQKTRSTLLMSEPIEEDTVASQKDLPPIAPTGNVKSKTRNTILLTEPIEEDFNALRQDDSKVLYHKPHKTKARSTLLMSEDIEEDKVGSRKDWAAVAPTGNLKSKTRNTLLMSEPIEEDTAAFQRDLPSIAPTGNVIFKARNTLLTTEPMEMELMTSSQTISEAPFPKHEKNKARSTLVMSEAIEEDIAAAHKNWPTIVSAKNVKCRARNTLLATEPMEEEKKLMSPIQNILENPLSKKQQPKARSTLLVSEDIEGDTVASQRDLPPIVPTGNVISKARNTLLTTEPMEMELMTSSQTISEAPFTKHEKQKARSTLLMSEAIKEDTVAAHTVPTGNLKSKARNTLLGIEPMEEEELMPPSQNISKLPFIKNHKPNARSALLMADATVASPKDWPSHVPTDNVKSKARNTLLLKEPIEEDFTVLRQDDSELPYTKSHIIKTKSTLLVSEDIEEDSVVSPKNVPSLFLNGNKSKSTPKSKGKPGWVAMTPRLPLVEVEHRSLCEFEFEEKMAIETPHRVPAQLTRVKRLHAQLTPNLPQSKKRPGSFHKPNSIDQDKEFNVDETVQVLREARSSRRLYEEVEDKPIDISDDSNYFEIQGRQEDENKVHVQRDTVEEKMIESDGIQTYNKFINISCDTTVYHPMDESSEQGIDEVRLSLVSNLIDEDADKENTDLGINPLPASTIDMTYGDNACLEMTLDRPIAAGSSSACKKCSNCRRSLASNTDESLVLSPPKSEILNGDLEHMERVRQKLHIKEIHKHFQRKEREQNYSIMGLPREEETEIQDEPFNSSENIKCYELMQLSQDIPQRCQIPSQAINGKEFFEILDSRLASEQPQWIVDHQLRVSRKLHFTHRQFTQVFRMVMTYDSPKDDMDKKIRITAIEIEPTSPHSSWLPLDHVLNFQLGLKLPLRLLDCLEGHDMESLVKFLKQVNQICLDIKASTRQMVKALSSNISILIRQQHRTVVRKTSHLIPLIGSDGILRIQEIEFMVEITNLEEISFKDIVQPQLYMFDEKIQFLPKGVAFLEAFLPNPEKYLKPSGNQ